MNDEILPTELDPVHTVCRCAICVHARLLRLLADLDREYGPWPLDKDQDGGSKIHIVL